MKVVRFWSLSPEMQESFRSEHPTSANEVWGIIEEWDDYLMRRRDAYLIGYIDDWLNIGSSLVQDALWELHERGLIDYDGHAITQIYAECWPRKAWLL